MKRGVEDSSNVGTPGQSSIETVVKLEQQAMENRSLVERVGEAIAMFSGSMKFFLLHVIAFVLWAIINAGLIPPIKPFDPYPFNFLTMVVSLEAVLLSTFLLMRQNGMSRRADRRDRLNLQIDLLSEKEITKILQLLQSIGMRLDVRQAREDKEVQEFSQNTAVDRLADELEKKIQQ